MDYFYKLKEKGKKLPFRRDVQLYEEPEGYFFFQDGVLYMYSGELSLKLEKNINVDEIHFFNEFVAARGVSDIFQYNKKDLSLISMNEDYNGDILEEGNGKVIKMGRLFNGDHIGLLICQDKFEFYEIINGNFLERKLPKYAEKVLNSKGCGSEIMIENLRRNGSDHVIVKGKENIMLFSFEDSKILELELDDNLKGEKVHFANLSGKGIKDMVFFTKAGLFIYSHDVKTNKYVLAYDYKSFSNYRKYSDYVKFVDIDSDGVDEMVANSPWGLVINVHNKYRKRFTNFLEVVPLPSRYDKIVHATGKFLITESKKGLKAYEISKRQIEGNIEWKVEKHGFLSKIPKMENVVEKEELPLQDTMDYSQIFSIGPTGKVMFALDLFGLEKSLEFSIHYLENSESDVLGVGWSIKEDRITRLHGSSIYEEDEKYILILKSIPIELKLKNSSFTIDGMDYKIDYFPGKQRFEMEAEKLKLIYGHVDNEHDGLEYELKWRDWNGPGGDSEGQIAFPRSWYLKRIITESYSINYKYKKIDVRTPNGMSYTREMYLSQIYDHKNKLEFFYDDKYSEEYDLPDLIDEETNNYNMNVVKTKYLSGYRLETPNNVQNIEFKYSLIDGKRFLKSIAQKGSCIMNFFYDEDVLESINVSNIILKYVYELGDSDDTFVKRVQIENYENYKINYLNRYIIASYNHQNMTVVQINDKEMVEIEKFTLNNKNEVVNFLMVKNMICALFNSGDIHIIHKEDNKFYDKGTFDFIPGTVFKPGGNFLMYQGKSVGVVEYDVEKGEYVKKELFDRNFSVTAAFNRFVAVYDNMDITLAYKSRNHWHRKFLTKIPGFINSLNDTLDLFDFSVNFKNDMYIMFADVMLQIFNNMLMINTVKYENKQFETRINVFLLNQTYDIVKEKEITVKQDNIETLVKDTHFQDSIYKTIYQPEGNKLKKKVIGFEGKLRREFDEGKRLVFEDIENRKENVTKEFENAMSVGTANAKAQANKFFPRAGDTYRPVVQEKLDKELKKLKNNLVPKRKAAMNELNLATQQAIAMLDSYELQICQNVTKVLPNDYSLLDRDKYSFYLFNGKIINKNVQYVYNGQDFIERPVVSFDDDIKLNKDYSLKKEQTYKIVKNYDEIDLEVSKLPDIYNGFPFYMGSKTKNGLKLIQFHKYKEPEENYINEEVFASGRIGFATRNQSTAAFRLEMIRYAFPDKRVKRITVNLGDRQFLTGYEYKSPKFDNVLNYQVFSIIPGDEKKHGRMELHNDTRKTFDGNGVLLKTKKNNVEGEEEDGTKEVEGKKLFHDKTGLFLISDFTPYDSDKDEVYYFGFEDYEINKKFDFNNDDVVKGFSLTGRHYLEVKSTFQGSFFPNDLSIYRLSCWIRPKKKLAVGEKTVLVKANVEYDGKFLFGNLGEILFEMKDWLYVEAVVDLSYADKEIDEINSSMLSIRVVISNCDLDNVLFAPNILKTSIMVFNEEGSVSEMMLNGLIKKYIYKRNKKVASTDIYGKLELFVSRGKNTTVEIKPVNGYYETFSLFSFGTSLVVDDTNWAVSPGVLHHHGDESVLKITSQNRCLSFDYRLKEDAEIIIGDLIIKKDSLIFQGESKESNKNGEIILIRIKDRCFVWLDGSVIFEKTAVFNLEMKFKGDAYIKNLFVFDEPSVKMEYLNGLKEKVQEIRLVDEKTALVREFLYDELGRHDIETRPILVKGNLFNYHENLVINKNPEKDDSVWKTGRIKGEAGEYSFTRVKFENSPLNRVMTVNRDPGSDSSPEVFFQSYKYNESYPLLRNVFPKDFYFVTEQKPGGVEKIKVYDPSDNWRGTYIKVTNGKGLLSTYEYNGTNLLQVLPPLYHEKVETLKKFDNRETVREKILKKVIGLNYKYDDKDRLIEMTSPDSGKTQYIYKDDLLSFIVYEDSVTFLEYERGLLTSTGVLEGKSLDSNKRVYLSFVPVDDKNPALRGSVFRSITYDKLTAIEEIVESEKVRTNRLILPDGLVMEFEKTAQDIYTEEVRYPVVINNKMFKIIYKYNRLGKLTHIYSNDGLVDVSYKYNGMKLSQEKKGEILRSYVYDEPGFLTKISDQFLTEEVSFKKGSYGGISFGDGTIVRTTFKAHWHGVTKPDDDCFKTLKERNYLDDKGHLIKDFYPYLEPDIINCTSVYEKYFPSSYGHAYTYGKYQQLTKAKFFVDEVPRILQPATFSGIPGLNVTASKEIWKSLKDSGFIIADKEFLDEHLVHSKKGKFIINPLIFKELKRKDINFELVENVLLGFFKDEDLEYILGKETTSILKKKGYVKDPYSEEFKSVLKNYKDQIKEIASFLRQSFATELGTNQYDIDHYAIDPNGNLLKFYNGFKKYDLFYKANTNKIDYIKINKVKYNFKHDKRGNVIRAEHKDIEKLVYNEVVNRVSEIHMKCGKVVHFSYDSSGKRIYKMVYKEGKIVKEVFYVRDDTGRTAVEKTVQGSDVLLTVYVYGPAGLTGFVRKNKFYKVLTDHEGSIRLVVRDGEVVAAYDYLPYGELMRTEIFDGDADLAYRFTGQEYDEETGLYNFHARLYDPSLGRFYQIDPKGQFFSPYLYAGNSPISLVDPDGEFAFFILAVTVIVWILGLNWDQKLWERAVKWVWAVIPGKFFRALDIVRKVAVATLILESLSVPIEEALVTILVMAGVKTAVEIVKSNSGFRLNSITTWIRILDKYVDNVEQISDFVINNRRCLKQLFKNFRSLKENTEPTIKQDRRGQLKGQPKDQPFPKKAPLPFTYLARRGKRSLEGEFLEISCNNVTFITRKDLDRIMYYIDGNATNKELNISLEKCLIELGQIRSDMNSDTVKRVMNSLSDIVINRARNFQLKEFNGFLINDEIYRAYSSIVIEILESLPDNETLKTIKENAGVFLKEIWVDYDLTDIGFVKKDPIKWKILNDDNLMLTSYKCNDMKCPLASVDWIGKEEAPLWDPSFPEFNSTLLLTDVLLAKKGKRSLYRGKRQVNMSWPKTMGYTLNIIDALENFLYEISGEEISLYQITGQIRDKIYKGNYNEITPLLDDYVNNSSIDFPVYQKERYNIEQKIHEILFENESNVLNDTGIFDDHPNSTFMPAENKHYNNPIIRLLSHDKH